MARVEETLLASHVLTKGKRLEDFLQINRLAGKEESVFAVFKRATLFLAEAGKKFYGVDQVKKTQERFLDHVCKFEIILGSPMLTNAGRREVKSISACSIPPVKLSTMSLSEISKIVGDYHSRGMGTGFCLDDLSDPVEMVKYLNEVAISEVREGKIERSCGNMGVLSIEHPRVLDFIRLKQNHPEIKEWKFNLSINLTDKFLSAFDSQTSFLCKDGQRINPVELMQEISKNAHATGDPGLIFMDRINTANRIPQAGKYKTVVPCGEVALFEGEVCQFSYINLPKFLDSQEINKESLRQAIYSAVLLLDNAVEANIQNMPNEQSAAIIESTRRIGIGICGFSELLQAVGLPYASLEARELAQNLMSFINFESKWASVALAKERGPFSLFLDPKTRKDLFIKPFKQHPTSFVTKEDWERLELFFDAHKIRNLATTILPPSGRSSLIAGVTASIEPPFRLAVDKALKKALEKSFSIYGGYENLDQVYAHIDSTGSVQGTNLPNRVKEVFATALEISPKDHVLMTAAFQKHVDEGISKTVNLLEEAPLEDVFEVFKSAFLLGLKGVTIYRDNCRSLQPKALKASQTILDSIYGPIQISDRIYALLQSPLINRLKYVHQNGINFRIDSRQATTRYEHAFGKLALTKMLGGGESEQIAALFREASQPVFSQILDFIFANKDQNYSDLMRANFLQSEIFLEEVKKYELPIEESFGINEEDLTIDRIDYCIRDLKTMNRIYHPEYSSILQNIDSDLNGKIRCKNIEIARWIFDKFLELNKEVYFHPRLESASVVMAAILQRMFHAGEIKEEDFFSTEDLVVEKIIKSSFRDIFESIDVNMAYSFSTIPSELPYAFRKLRYVDPEIVGMKGRLTDHCSRSKAILEEYLAAPKKVYYEIPILRSLK
jgi:ribonucleoside-diphosphate reductase alpha chain